MKILYFAWLRTKTGTAQETAELAAGIATVADLVAQLRGLSAGHAEAFSDLDSIRVAVNQDYVGWDHPVKSGDEIAFFPPVTGG
jgi:molybdopterin synthase sulfur carrier subunit